jgi:hypothetical protein
VRSIKNTTKFNTNTIGFYATKGNSINNSLENSKAPSMADFLESIKDFNKTFISLRTRKEAHARKMKMISSGITFIGNISSDCGNHRQFFIP